MGWRALQSNCWLHNSINFNVVQVQVSLGRISNFLKDDELDNCVERKQNDARAVEMQDATLSWQPGGKIKPTLRGINLDVKSGDHVAVCGAVGSGKSTLLYSIMGEIPKISGKVSSLCLPAALLRLKSGLGHLSLNCLKSFLISCLAHLHLIMHHKTSAFILIF